MIVALQEIRRHVARHLAKADPDRVTTAQAAELVTLFAEIERLGAAGKTLFSARAAQSTVWRDEGHRSAAAWMAEQAKVGLGDAMATLETAEVLPLLPGTEQALRNGDLSTPQVRAIAVAGAACPDQEGELLAAASSETLKGLRERCAQIRAAAGSAGEENERYAAIKAKRYVRHWADADGAFRLDAKLTPDAGAQLVSALTLEADARFAEARKAQEHEPPCGYLADALVALVTTGGMKARGRASSKAGRPTVCYRVDATALLRGHVEHGEVCVIAGIGPVPVAVVKRQLSDAYVKILVTDGVDVSTVCHVGRTVPAHLQSALEERDPCCVVPGCGVANGLENHHWDVPYAECGSSTLAGLARVCAWHHDLLTYDGYALAGGPGQWEMRAPPDGGRFDLS